jgi:Rps23 Pro-64 3,4-dihydroxylase Tpa1-like proline 4-hydroxylase
MIRLFDLNPALDRAALAREFATTKRLQIRDLLTEESARNLHRVLAAETPWGLAYRAAPAPPENFRREQLSTLAPAQLADKQKALFAALREQRYGFLYSQYPILDAYQQGWSPGGPHDAVLELINDAPFLDFMREVTGISQLVKADAQATLYGPGQFLALHDDSHREEGWQIAYVLNLCAAEWREDWGGYLNFFDEHGDVEQGFRPRFNALNIFQVPQPHNVGYVPPFAPVERYAITGWFRDR